MITQSDTFTVLSRDEIVLFYSVMRSFLIPRRVEVCNMRTEFDD